MRRVNGRDDVVGADSVGEGRGSETYCLKMVLRYLLHSVAGVRVYGSDMVMKLIAPGYLSQYNKNKIQNT